MESEPKTAYLQGEDTLSSGLAPALAGLREASRPDHPAAPAPSADIVVFAKDWDDNNTSNHHVVRRLARNRRVLWLNSVGNRAPSLASGRDLGRIFRKLREYARGPVNVEADLWVFTPLVIPLHHKAWARKLNERILRRTIRRLLKKLEMPDFHLWTFLPSVGQYVGTLGESLSVYYCADEFSLFSNLDGEHTRESEHALLERVDCVFAVNEELAEAKRMVNPETFTAPHGVDHERFARALEPGMSTPQELEGLTGPVIGFYGTLEDWVDVDLLAEMAHRHPEWSIVLVGPMLVDLGPLSELDNVHVTGRRPHEQLPAFCKAFDVGLIPYRMDDERMEYVNPIKLREYLSAGLPVVSTDFAETRRYAGICSVTAGREEFIRAVEAELAADTPRKRRERSEAMVSESWEARVEDIDRAVGGLAARNAAGALLAA